MVTRQTLIDEFVDAPTKSADRKILDELIKINPLEIPFLCLRYLHIFEYQTATLNYFPRCTLCPFQLFTFIKILYKLDADARNVHI